MSEGQCVVGSPLGFGNVGFTIFDVGAPTAPFVAIALVTDRHFHSVLKSRIVFGEIQNVESYLLNNCIANFKEKPLSAFSCVDIFVQE